MERIEITGNLGANAEFRNENGNEFVKFNVGCTDRYEKADGSKVERVTWYSCILNGRQEKLLPYLTKGTKVYVRGEIKLRVFSSEKDRMMKAGANVTVRELELIGGITEAVPRQLSDEKGLLYNTMKCYWIEKPATGIFPTMLQNPRNTAEKFNVDANGFVTPAKENSQQATPETPEEQNQPNEEHVEVY